MPRPESLTQYFTEEEYDFIIESVGRDCEALSNIDADNRPDIRAAMEIGYSALDKLYGIEDK